MRRTDGIAATTTTTGLTPFPTVENRVNASTDLWANDLRTVFEEARDRFADISWESETGERVWAHKGGDVLAYTSTDYSPRICPCSK